MSDSLTAKDIFKKCRDHVSRFFRRFMAFLRGIWILFKQSFRVVMLFILLCSVFTIMATSVLKDLLITLMMKVTGVEYIVPANLSHVLFNPVSIILMIIFAVIITLFSLFEIAGLLHAFSMGQAGRTTNIMSMFAAGLRACRKALHPKNWLLIVFILVLFPLTRVFPLATSTFKLILPGFVDQTIDYTRGLNVVYRIGYVALILILTVYLFSINSFVMQKDSFMKSCRGSRLLERGHFVETLLSLILLTIILNFAINSISSIIVINTNEVTSMIFGNSKNIIFKAENVGTSTYLLRQILKSFISPAVNNAALAVLFYRYVDEKDMLLTLSKDTFKAKKTSWKGVIAFLIVLAVFSSLTSVYWLHRYSFLFEPVDQPLVCAHRGDNVNAPENTMPAFEMAASENLQWIELDVHQTSDGVIICNHDSTIKRVTGQNLAIHDHTYEELTACEFGAWMPGNYEHVVVPTLAEVLLFAKENHMNVQVELKGHADDVNFEENVLQVINDTGMHDDVMVIAQDLSRLQRVNELDPTITKAYCVVVGLGDLEHLECSDNISIEESYITPELVRDMHAQGKKVFCWTVDNDDTVQYLISCDVDVIGTDNPMLISNAVEKGDCSGGFTRIFHIILHVIANMDK